MRHPWFFLLAFPPVWLVLHYAAIALDVAPGVSLWYPPAGLSLAFVLIFPRFWPVLFVGIGYVVATGSYVADPVAALLSWAIPPLGYVAGGLLIRSACGGVPDLGRVADLVRFLAGAALTAGAVAMLNVVNFCNAGVIPWADYAERVRDFALGDLLGVVTLTPLFLLHASGSRIRQRGIGKAVASMAALAGILLLEAHEVTLGGAQRALSYFLLLPVAWNAVALGMAGAAISGAMANVSIAVSSALGAVAVVGPGTPYFMISLACVGLLIGAMVEERARALADLNRSQAAIARSYTRFSVSESAGKLIHELRHPVASLMTYAHGLQSGPRPGDDVAALAGRMVAEAERAAEILDRARSETEAEALARRPLVLDQLVAEAWPVLHELAESQAITLRREVASSGIRILGDRVALMQVLTNLVRNAAEALAGTGGKGVVTIVLDRAGDWAVIRVRDNGPGFEDYVRRFGHALYASRKPGSDGFGLPISRVIAEAHGGTLHLDNAPDGGAIAELRLPLRKEEAT